MRILIDGDACPVRRLACAMAKQAGVDVLVVCDTSHVIIQDGATVVTVDKGADSADLVLANLVNKDDLVITQDYGVAAMVLAKGAKAMHQDGFLYTKDNMDRLLFERFLGKEVRRAGGRTKGPKKRTKAQDQAFADAFSAYLQKKLDK